MKYARLLVPAIATFAVGAWLAPSGGRGALRRSVLEAEARRVAGQQMSAPERLLFPSEDAADARMGRLLSALQETFSPLKRGHDLYEAVRGLTSPEIAQLLADAEKLPESHRREVRQALLQRWFDVDAVAAESWVHTQPRDHDAWKIWAERMPEHALAEMHAGHLDRDLATAIFEGAYLANTGDERERAKMLAALPADDVRDEHLGWDLHFWSDYDPSGAIVFARTLPPGNLRKQAIRYALKVLSARDPLAALKLASAQIQDFQGEPGGDVSSLAELARAASQRDRPAAMQWVAQLPEDQRVAPAREIACVWAESDPRASFQWAAAHGVAVSDLISSGMAGKPEQTLQWIQTQPVGPEREKMLVTALTTNSKLTTAGISSADRSTALGLLGQLSTDAQLNVVKWLGSPDGSSGGFARSTEWIAALPDGPLRVAALASAGRYYGGVSQRVFEEHLSDYPGGPIRDSVYQGIARAQSQYVPSMAADTVLKIGDPRAQQNALDELMPDWLGREPRKAQAWITKTSLFSAEQIAQWREESQWSVK